MAAAARIDAAVQRRLDIVPQEPVSIDQLTGSGFPLAKAVADPADRPAVHAEARVLVRQLRSALHAHLTEQERTIVTLRFGLDGGEPRSLLDVGRATGLSRETVRVRIGEAQRRLRTALGLLPGDLDDR